MPFFFQKLTNVFKLKPQFLIVGAQKAGTTSLFKYLAQHPAIQAPENKEIGFFCWDKSYALGTDWYNSQFPYAVPFFNKKITYEATTEYLVMPSVPERIAKYNKNMKIVVLVRDPIERAYSQYQMYVRKKELQKTVGAPTHRHDTDAAVFLDSLKFEGKMPTFEQAIMPEYELLTQKNETIVPAYLYQGFYAQHLNNYLRFFDKKQIFVIENKELENNTLEVLKKLFFFLELPTQSIEYINVQKFNAGTYKMDISSALYSKLKDLYTPHNELLFEMIGKKFDWLQAY